MFRVIETFSGIGSQAKALERIGCQYEIVNTVDWDINAIIAYYMIHHNQIDEKKYESVNIAEIEEYLQSYTLSSDGKKPINKNSIKRMPTLLKRKLYIAIKETNNLVSITDVKGKDIPSNIDLFTYSFPCQDLSICGFWHGNTSGISRNAHNRSGMLWEVERILLEMHEESRPLPKFLLMENVTNILSKPNKKDFDDWKSTLEYLGYYNKVYKLNAKDFGVPQKRQRAYMISVQCNFNEKLVNNVKQYFEQHSLENENKLKNRNMQLKDILCIDYSNTKYKQEADESTPNNTPSRQLIRESNQMLFINNTINEIPVNTITTKQDRNPNAGLISYQNSMKGKTDWRYLTPRECFKLMGFDEEDFDKLVDNNISITKNRKIFSNATLLKLAGNSIVVDVLEALFKQIIDINTTILRKQ